MKIDGERKKRGEGGGGNTGNRVVSGKKSVGGEQRSMVLHRLY